MFLRGFERIPTFSFRGGKVIGLLEKEVAAGSLELRDEIEDTGHDGSVPAIRVGPKGCAGAGFGPQCAGGVMTVEEVEHDLANWVVTLVDGDVPVAAMAQDGSEAGFLGELASGRLGYHFTEMQLTVGKADHMEQRLALAAQQQPLTVVVIAGYKRYNVRLSSRGLLLQAVAVGIALAFRRQSITTVGTFNDVAGLHKTAEMVHKKIAFNLDRLELGITAVIAMDERNKNVLLEAVHDDLL